MVRRRRTRNRWQWRRVRMDTDTDRRTEHDPVIALMDRELERIEGRRRKLRAMPGPLEEHEEELSALEEVIQCLRGT